MAEVKKPKIKKHSGGVELDFSNQQTPWDRVPISQPTPEAQSFQSPDYQPDFNVTAPPQPPTQESGNGLTDEDVANYQKQLESLQIVDPQRDLAGIPVSKYIRGGGDMLANAKDMLNAKLFGTTDGPKKSDALAAANAVASPNVFGGIAASPFDPEKSAVEKQLIEESLKRMAESEDQLGFLRGQPAQTDLSGLMALADTWGKGGGIYTKAYNKPNTVPETVTLQQKLEDMVMGQRKDLLGELSKAQQTKALQSQVDQLWKGSRQYDNQVDKLLKDAQTTVTKGADKWGQTVQTYKNLLGAINSGNKAKIMSNLDLMLKSGGAVGTQTEGDISRQIRPTLQGFVSDLKEFFKGQAGNLPPGQIANLRSNAIERFAAVINARKEFLRNQYDTFAARAKGFKADDLAQEGGALKGIFDASYDATKTTIKPLKEGMQYYMRGDGTIAIGKAAEQDNLAKKGIVPIDPNSDLFNEFYLIRDIDPKMKKSEIHKKAKEEAKKQ